MKVMAWHYRAGVMGFLFILPFIIINFIVAFRIQPFYAFLGSFPLLQSSPIFPLLLLLLFPVGALVSVYPMLFKEKDGTRKIPIFNSILSTLLLAIFLFLFIPLGRDAYKCQILKIPNCD